MCQGSIQCVRPLLHFCLLALLDISMLGGLALQHCITQHIWHIIVVFIELQRCAVPSKIIHVRIPERTKSVLVCIWQGHKYVCEEPESTLCYRSNWYNTTSSFCNNWKVIFFNQLTGTMHFDMTWLCVEMQACAVLQFGSGVRVEIQNVHTTTTVSLVGDLRDTSRSSTFHIFPASRSMQCNGRGGGL